MNRVPSAAVGVVLAAALCAPGPGHAGVCVPEDSGHVVLSRGEVSWPGRGVPLRVVVRGDLDGRNPEVVRAVTVTFLDDELERRDCRVLLEVAVPGMDSARARPGLLGAQPVIHLITERHGGSGDHFAHRLFAVDAAGFRAIPSPPLEQSNMDGFFVGELGGGRGPGAALWSADRETHYALPRDTVPYYRWRDGRLEPAGRVDSRRWIAPDPDTAARAMGLPFRDQTGPDLMPFAGFRP